jgi:hypothetical protein
MVSKAAGMGLLQPLSRRALQHRISLYADDAVLFLRPEAANIQITMDLLQLFGEASGLQTNLQKSNVLPIRCGDEEIQILQQHLPCEITDFPCKYLGLPLSLRKLSSDSIQPIIDSIADQLPGWKADLTTRAGRRVHVQFVLTSKLVYLALAVDFPQWAHKEVNKIRRGYLWRGHTNAKRGHCLVAWDSVCRPLELGGLGISNLPTLGWALKVRWLWLQKTQPQRPWSSLPIQIPEQDRAFFSVAMASEVGNGAHTFFWTDWWLHGKSITELAPRLHAGIPKRKAKSHTVQEALNNHAWVSDFAGALSVGVMVEYLQLWDLLQEVVLQPEVKDTHFWCLSPIGQYSAK